MKIKIPVVCAIVAVLLSLCACSPKAISVDVSCDDFYNQQHINREIEVPAGGSLTVTLCSNPTTGFIWSESAQISDQTVLQQTDHKIEPPGDSDVVGGAGTEVWTFEALGKGESTIYLEYGRPWEGGEKAEWTYTLTVTVK